ncbi:hypothetical protein SDC9_17790 [bioreactor metagenome]|uniref:Phospholipase D-like domain-containing protein n=1 Tax=bioreactor metagenome TaxID=1076179 RepID=A0A644U297_9ZZZZ|nr:hypothetical protein [Methanobrevibacter sp.]MEA4956491.1 hypothetical protein [Methanobrevibacter sp.]
MGLNDLDMKHKYDSDVDNIINDFYIPVLSESCKYYRLSGFFSSSVLAVVARGMENFIKNDGKMYLICSALLPEKDIKVIEENVKNNSNVLENYLIKSLDDIEKGFVEDHVSALAWMLEKGNLKIKIAIVSDKGAGMFHQKVGILEDIEKNSISFSGSNNETASGLLYNIEDFKVFRNWEKGEKDYFEDDHDAFCKYWNDLGKQTKVLDLPDAVAQEQEATPTKVDIRLVKRNNSKAVRHGNVVYMKWLTFKNFGASGSQIINAKVIIKNLKYKLWKVYNKKLNYKFAKNNIKFKLNLKSNGVFKLKLKVYRPIK